jgi:hypothetical protein
MALHFREVGERKGTAGAGRALGQVVAPGVNGSDQGSAERVEVGDFRVDLGQFGRGAVLEAGSAVPVAAGLQRFGDLVQGEAQALGGLDDPRTVTASSP